MCFYKSSYLKHNLANSFLVTLIAEFTAKLRNSEKAVTFCHLCLVQ